MRVMAFRLLQWIWGLPQNLAGLLFLLWLGRQRHEQYHGAVITYVTGHSQLARRGCASLGMFIFMSAELSLEQRRMIRVHEYGHCIQSLLFGPLYLLLVGLPSLLWAAQYGARHRTKGIAYTSRYPENQANNLGRRVTGEEPICW